MLGFGDAGFKKNVCGRRMSDSGLLGFGLLALRCRGLQGLGLVFFF